MRVGVLGFGFDRRASRVPWRLLGLAEIYRDDIKGRLPGADTRHPSISVAEL